MIKKSIGKSEIKSVLIAGDQVILNLENGNIIAVRSTAKKIGYGSYESKTEYVVIPNRPAKDFSDIQLEMFLFDPLEFATA